MPRSLRLLLNFALILCIPTLFAAKGKCRKPPPVDTDTDAEVDVQVPDVAVALQIVTVSPSQVPPATPTPVRLYGAAFEQGANVFVGAFRVADARVTDPNTIEFTAPGLPEGSHDVRVANPDGKEATLRQGIRAVAASGDASCALMAMYFELDSATLAPTVVQALNASLPCLRSKGTVRLEGHADERGTTDYNVALAQRRAESIQRWLTSQGIPIGNLPVLSYGEERPADPGHNEAAWAKNRRVDMIAR